MKFKKLASLALAGALSFSLAVPAFAAGNSETDITGTYTPPTISVVVPQTAAAFINPLGLDVQVATNTTLTGRQIISAPMALKNKGASDLQVGATVTTTVGTGSDMRFVNTTTGGTGSGKTVFAYLQAKQEPSLKGADSAVTDAAVATAFAAWNASAYDSTKDVVCNTALASTQDNLVILRAASMTGSTFTAYKENSVALVRLAGDCVATPTAGSWAATTTNDAHEITGGDSFTVNVAYTFKPASITKYDVTVDPVTDPNTTGGTAAADVAKAAAGDTVTVTLTLGSSSTHSITVKDASNNTVTATETATGSGIYTFTMPAGAVTVAATFG